MLNGSEPGYTLPYSALVTKAELVPIIKDIETLRVNEARDGQRLSDALEKIGEMSQDISSMKDSLLLLADRKALFEQVCLYSIKAVWWCVGSIIGLAGLHLVGIFKYIGKWLIS